VRTAFGLDEVPRGIPTSILALGTFDGLHVGHQQVVGGAVARARVLGGAAVALTFEPHPLEVLRPSAEPVLLTLVPERLALFEQIGVDLALVLPFDLEFCRIPAHAWLDDILRTRMGAREIFAGSSYTFGYRREGTASRLLEWGHEWGIPVHLVPAVLVSGEPVSSTRIRTALREGLVDEAARLLGRWYSLGGRVVSGSGRGRTIGFPTANLETPARKVLPGRGVYATVVDLDGRRYGGATNVGVRPTFGETSLSVETHLLDFDGDLRDTVVTLSFVRRIRAERAFPGPEALALQIREDVARVRELLAVSGPGIIR
jgi:riboflavin kinase / FMN adenylyltransferase